MLISKKSPRPSERFFTGPGNGNPGDFPLRRYMRLREDLGSGAAHAALTLVLLALVVALGRAALGLFRVRGAGLSPWYGRSVWMLIAIFTLSVARVLYYKFRDLRRIRREMQHLRATFRQSGDGDATAGNSRQRRH